MPTTKEIKEYMKKQNVDVFVAKRNLTRKELTEKLKNTKYINEIKSILLEILNLEFGGYE